MKPMTVQRYLAPGRTTAAVLPRGATTAPPRPAAPGVGLGPTDGFTGAGLSMVPIRDEMLT